MEYLEENNIELSFSKTADKLNQVVNNNLNTLTTYLGEFPDTNKTGIKEKEAKYILKYFWLSCRRINPPLQRINGDKELDYSIIICYKDNDIVAYNHDLWAIEYIKELRNKRVTKLEKAKALFLTCDLNLVKYNFCAGGHRDDGTLNEVISTFTLSNILWFKDPGVNNDLPLNSAISIHANSLFLDNEFWNDFYNKLEQMKEQEIIDEEDISYLAYNTSLENTLADLNDNQKEIKEDQIIKIIEDSRQKYKDKEVEIAAEAEEKDKIKAENERLNEKVDYSC